MSLGAGDAKGEVCRSAQEKDLLRSQLEAERDAHRFTVGQSEERRLSINKLQQDLEDIKVQWATVMQWCSGAAVRWCSGAVVRWCSGAVVQWYGDTLTQWCSGTVIH
eukprot:1195982-Prorocentrum_minimum.AAC.5